MSEYPHLDVDRPKPRVKGTRINVVQIYDMVKSLDGGVTEVAERYIVDEEEIEEALRYYDEHEEELEAIMKEDQELSELAMQLQEEGKL